MKYFVLLFSIVLITPLSLAEDSRDSKLPDDSELVAPKGAKNCEIPESTPKIPENADKSELIQAQNEVKTFQSDLADYRACLDALRDNTEDESLALDILYDKSVIREEEVADRFNDAIQAWKKRSGS